MTSQYAYLYNQYPFTQRPERGSAAPGLVDHRVRVRAAVDEPALGSTSRSGR